MNTFCKNDETLMLFDRQKLSNGCNNIKQDSLTADLSPKKSWLEEWIFCSVERNYTDQ